MEWVLWFSVFLSGLLAETVLLPRFFGAAVPALTLAILIVALAHLEFSPGFWFAAFVGMIGDVAAPLFAVSHVMFSLGIFFAMRSFLALRHWYEPVRRIGAVFFGLVGVPLAWSASGILSRIVLGTPFQALRWAELTSGFFLREVIFALVWAAAFSWFTLSRYKRHRALELTHV